MESARLVGDRAVLMVCLPCPDQSPLYRISPQGEQHPSDPGTSGHAAMRCGIELSADEILGEPDDQVVIHGHLHAFGQRPLSPACAPAVGDIATPSVQP